MTTKATDILALARRVRDLASELNQASREMTTRLRRHAAFIAADLDDLANDLGEPRDRVTKDSDWKDALDAWHRERARKGLE
jgi:hypothetical protein